MKQMNDNTLAVFENYKIRHHYDEKNETWYFSVVDILQVLIQQPNYQAARNYWKVLKNRLNKEGSETVTKCNRLKMVAEDGKMRFTDAADPKTLLRLIQSVPSPKAEPIKLWLAKTGYERMQDMADPARSLDRTKGLLAPARQKQKMDSAKNDGAGNPQQAHRLLERSCKTGDGSLFENPLLSLAK